MEYYYPCQSHHTYIITLYQRSAYSACIGEAPPVFRLCQRRFEVHCLFEDGLQDGGVARRGKDVAHQLLHMWGREARHTRYGGCEFEPPSIYGVCMSMWVAVGCKRVLKRDAYMVHEGDPFCQACYWENNRLFKPQGDVSAAGGW